MKSCFGLNKQELRFSPNESIRFLFHGDKVITSKRRVDKLICGPKPGSAGGGS